MQNKTIRSIDKRGADSQEVVESTPPKKTHTRREMPRIDFGAKEKKPREERERERERETKTTCWSLVNGGCWIFWDPRHGESDGGFSHWVLNLAPYA